MVLPMHMSYIYIVHTCTWLTVLCTRDHCVHSKSQTACTRPCSCWAWSRACYPEALSDNLSNYIRNSDRWRTYSCRYVWLCNKYFTAAIRCFVFGAVAGQGWEGRNLDRFQLQGHGLDSEWSRYIPHKRSLPRPQLWESELANEIATTEGLTTHA